MFLIWDNLPVHRARAVQDWLAERPEQIEVFHLPPYSPELNPDELLNQELKSNVFREKRPHNKNDLKALLKNKLYAIQKQPEKIQAYFKGPYVRYASA